MTDKSGSRACLKDVPNHLIFNLKRFDFDITTMTRCKINDEFQFPEWIDMAPYTVDHLSQPDQPIDPDIFDLVGVLVHSGTAESGHYYSYIRERPSSRAAKDSWVQFNDSEVSVFDHSRINDCCFGGLDFSSPLNFSKAYNAYMLFYQRRASIQKFEGRYREHDLTSPVRLPLTQEREQHLTLDNELFLRSYCAQDRSHAKFMRQILERMRSGQANRCSHPHETETRTLGLVLEYIQQVSCRFKDLPEFEVTIKILSGYVSQCNTCAEQIMAWYLVDSNFRDTVLRNPLPAVRRAFSSLLHDALRMLKFGTRAQGLTKSRVLERNEKYRLLLRRCVDMLEDQWEDMSKFARAWNDYFELLSHISFIGVLEASQILEAGFLEKVLEIIWIDGRGDPRKLKRKYPHYVTVREKGRVFSHSGLLGLLHALLDRLNLDLGVHPDGEREESRRLLGASPAEIRLISPSNAQHHTGVKLEWLRRVIIGYANPMAIGGIVGNLAQYEELGFFTANTLVLGLAAEQVAEATTYLDPTLVFCCRCPTEHEVLRVVKEALGGIDSINSHYGRDHFNFVAQLMKAENESLGWNQHRFQTLVLNNADSWAPALLLYPENLHYDVSQETVDLLTEYLLGPLESPDLPASEKAVLGDYAMKLVNGCVRHIRANYIVGRAESLSSLEVGQTKQIAKVVAHIVEHYFPSDSAEDESRTEVVRQTMAALDLRVQTVVETLSESWADNDSIAVSDSDNADIPDFAANTP
jgi:ubiquitin carboxyl-terminal hydrolase 34